MSSFYIYGTENNHISALKMWLDCRIGTGDYYQKKEAKYFVRLWEGIEKRLK